MHHHRLLVGAVFVGWMSGGVFGVWADNTVLAQNWPSFRGPNASGVSDQASPPRNWNVPSGENILWETPIPGLGHSSPVVWGDRVFVTTAVGTQQDVSVTASSGRSTVREEASLSWRVLGLDRTSGRILWQRTAYEGRPRTGRHAKASYANATPATDGRHLVVSFGSQGLYCYDLDGNLQWKVDLGVLDAGYVGLPEHQWGTASSPLIYRNLVIVQCDSRHDSFMAAYELDSGQRVWVVRRDENPSWSTPVIADVGDRVELVTSSPNYFRGSDPLTGRELWRFADRADVKVPTPVVGEGLIYFSGGAPRGRRFLALRVGGHGDISLAQGQETNSHVAWQISRGGPYTPTPILYRGFFYVLSDNGVFSAYRADSGEVVYRRRVPGTGAAYSASPVAAAGCLYLSSQDGVIHLVRAGADFELLASNPIGETLMATPALSADLLIVRAKSHLLAVREKNRTDTGSLHERPED